MYLQYTQMRNNLDVKIKDYRGSVILYRIYYKELYAIYIHIYMYTNEICMDVLWLH